MTSSNCIFPAAPVDYVEPPDDTKGHEPGGSAAHWLGRATELGLVELIDVASTPLLRRALSRNASQGNDLIAIRLVPESAGCVERRWCSFPLAHLTKVAPIVVDLSSIRLPAPVAVQLLAHLDASAGPLGQLCVVAGSVQRRAELFSLTRPAVALFASLADALQNLAFSTEAGQRRWTAPKISTGAPPHR